MSVHDAIIDGIVFRGASKKDEDGRDKVKTKAKRTSYVKGAHGSGSAKMKAEFHRKRMNRHK